MRFDKSGPRGPTNVPLFCRIVINIGGMISVGLHSVSFEPYNASRMSIRPRQRETHMFVNTRLAADCITAILPAAGLLPRDVLVSDPSELEVSLNTSTPSLISFHRIQEMLPSQQDTSRYS